MSFFCHDALVTIAALEYQKVIDFYRKLLSQEPQPYIAEIYGEFHLPGLRLGIFYPKISHQSEFNNSTYSGMSICLEVENLEKAIAYLHQIGYPPPGEIITASHGREIYAYDPAGNRLILHQSN
ncbi:glyoxalase/bleomycin resistance protein/dioxygenase [Stanieria cyanosphaera PCC 7437]|uniref:Glyoxalase/bleomycin resistance protein/dioxygenase n=1 Tax=Stanieria cyanosphaera (strain ATCC 29371 / PCC 7437) TaxID=111780 RepID=K9XQL6_STAC7|nr:glyoxalase/bleomycin resistance protein/dioxygenase [Stanieria cyanosphaera]AFZ34910.1 glyoxalase/bleomycin resistance protein/dioxygenase [Stanieria cyanosphaera PCC 7437]